MYFAIKNKSNKLFFFLKNRIFYSLCGFIPKPSTLGCFYIDTSRFAKLWLRILRYKCCVVNYVISIASKLRLKILCHLIFHVLMLSLPPALAKSSILLK